MVKRVITPEEILKGKKVSLRLVTLRDCTETYVSWLKDPLVNQYLETRWTPQTMDTVRHFVTSIQESTHSYLFGIIEAASSSHMGNIKIGPIHPHHQNADISFFIGEKSAWGKGYATEAIQLVRDFAAERLKLHRVQAGLYASNKGSARSLEKAGFHLEGRLVQYHISGQQWEDRLLYSCLLSK